MPSPRAGHATPSSSMSKYKDKESGALVSFNAKWVSWAHTAIAYAAFLSALVAGMYLHYHKIVQNQYYGYPVEWFPSVSATIGDRYPERSFFMVFIAMTSGPRFALVALWYLLTAKPGQALPKFVAGMGLFRTLMCGGWTYVTSTDDHDWHDIFMISYLVATIPWTVGCLALSPPNPKAIKYRKYLAAAFFGTIVPMVYFFIQHKVHRVPGAYTTYAFFEWSLILYDVAFDAVTALDFDTFEIVVKDVKGLSKGTSVASSSAVALEKEKEKATAGLFDTSFSWPEVLDTAAGVYHGYVFWSMLTGMGVLIWYFPLWYMGISGYEAFVMSTISPLLLGIKPVRSLVVRNLRFFHFLSLVGLLAWQVKDPAYRLSTTGFAVATSCLAWAATLFSESVNEARLESRLLAWLAGLIMSSAVKFAWQTNNPIWPIMHAENGGYNATGLALALLAALRFTRKAPLNTGAPANDKRNGSSLLAALGVAGVFFGLHSLLSDTSTMILWVWEGYPVRGPLSAPHGWFTLAAMTAGLLTGIRQPRLLGTWSVYGVGCVGAAVLTFYANWIGYFGALATAFYLTAVAIPLLGMAAKKSPAVTFGLGFFLYNVMVLFHVWVVAYAFVPGGPLVRERTDWVMLTMMLLIGAGVFNLTSVNARRSETRKPSLQSRHRKYHTLALGVINLFFLAAAYIRFPANDYQPYHGDSRIMTAGIWTIHFSLDNDMWSSEHRIRDLIKELEIDVIGFLETDTQRIIMGNRDTSQSIAEDLGMYVDYGPGPNKHTWGAALLSKFPIMNSTHHLLPSPVGELAPAIHATLDVYGGLVDVFVFHSGQEEDPEDRRLQTEYLSKLMGASTRPSVLLSYLVTKPLEGNYNTYVSDISGMHDVEPSDWDRWCEYILYKGLSRVGYARVSRSTITDTELQVAKFVVPKGDDEKAQVAALDGNPQARDRRVRENEVPEDWRFPAMFRGQGVRGHRYHVFNEPWYYKPA
ncbi:Frag1/DRAM/Sfk1 family-domain-containing protein [Xylariaceae sp. FL0804]|nr:Frag1/DRAM/Sfk1 family-domain-containing protein [Xylariaceae sp. FL0804]